MSRLLVVGTDGMIGSALTRHWRERGQDPVVTTRRTHQDSGAIVLDLSAPPDTWPVLPACDAAVLCAGIATLDTCRDDPVATRRVNVDHMIALATRLAERGCFVVFLSTNRVFDGTRAQCPTDEPTNPRTEYGRQKADAEWGIAQLGASVAIVRLTKVFHPALALTRGWIASLRAGGTVTSFGDMVCAPITPRPVAQAIARVAEERAKGIWHLSGAEDITYVELARRLARRAGRDDSAIISASAHDVPRTEHVPQHTTLDAQRSQTELDFAVPDANASIDAMLGERDSSL